MASEKQQVYYELLVLRCRRRDEQALQELVSAWETRLFYYVSRLVDNEQDVWDILQETWLKVIGGIRTLREPAALPTWLYRIARNTAMSHLRKRYADKALTDAAEQAMDPQVETQDFTFEDAERVHHGLDHLSLHHREVLTLCFLEDMSVEQIASVLEIPPGTVKSRLYYAKRALKDVLEREEAAT